MHKRMTEPTKCRLKRNSFTHVSRKLERQQPELLATGKKDIATHSEMPLWKRKHFPIIRTTVPGILAKDTQSDAERKSMTLEHMADAYPQQHWTHAYTDGSAEEATRNGGAGITITLASGKKVQRSIPTGQFCSNYKAEADALHSAANLLIDNKQDLRPNVVIFSDALSVLQALQNPRIKELNHLVTALNALQESTGQTVIQWIPSHCNIRGNEEADQLAKEGGQLPQKEQNITFTEAKTILKEKQRKKWQRDHPNHNKNDPYYLLTREEQVIIVRLRTGHCRLNQHMFTKFRIGDSSLCPCGTANMTVEHLLQECPIHHHTRLKTWPTELPLREKLFGTLESLQCTAIFIRDSGVSV